MEPQNIEYRIEEFIRTQFSVSPADPKFDPGVDLFEAGYIDSMGIVELLEFLSQEFDVQIPDDDLLSEDFSSIMGIAQIVSRNLGLRNEPLRMAQRPSSPPTPDSGLQGG
jgi:acyl carrier protein